MENLYFYITASIGVFLFGISKGGFAGPIAILAIPIMTLSINPIKAAAILLPILLIMDFIAIYIYWNKWDIKNIKTIIPASIIGIFIGALTFEFSSVRSIKIIVGAIAILFIFLTLFQKNNSFIKPTKKKGRFWSLFAGYTSFIIHAGGPPMSVYLLPQKLDKTVYVGTITLAFLIINLIKLIPYYLLDQLVISNLKISLYLSPMAPISIYLGYYLHKRVEEKFFYFLIYVFLGFSGLKLIYDGVIV
ncbi:MAG: hypothetical protein CFH19_00699 [Alphaproteobacteria bacterium MarineAlpha5_Bin9]|nr:MAG: hypothetical protein CFH19_00699 [Alphaproteobacteria bacterium MarineAlpha5_Bin9]